MIVPAFPIFLWFVVGLIALVGAIVLAAKLPGLWKLASIPVFILSGWLLVANGLPIFNAFIGKAPAATSTETATPTDKKEVDTSNSHAVVGREQAEGWPKENGKNAATPVTAPKGKFLLVNYGAEARDASGAEVPGCGAALVYPGETITITFWDANGEWLDGGETDAVAYAQSLLASRMTKDTNCKVWIDPIGFTMPTK